MGADSTTSLTFEKGFWWDAHCHLADPAIQDYLPGIIERSQRAGVRGWVIGGVSPTDWLIQEKIKALYGPWVLTSVGLHPWWVSQTSKSEVETALTVLDETAPKAAAIGEVGLDRSSRYDGTQARAQQKFAVEHALQMSKKADKPLILHVVQAHSQMIELLDRWGPFPRGGMVHGFTGSPEIAQEYLKRGFLISIGKGILKPGYVQLKKTAVELREDQITLETDSSEPAELIAVAEALAALRGCSQSDLLKRTSLNLSRIFEIKGT